MSHLCPLLVNDVEGVYASSCWDSTVIRGNLGGLEAQSVGASMLFGVVPHRTIQEISVASALPL